jgi:hypothetical protein
VCALAALAVMAAPIHAQRTNGPVWKAVSTPHCDGLDFSGNYKTTDLKGSDKCKNMREPQFSSEVTYPGDKEATKIGYQVIARSGDPFGTGVFGAVIDSKGQQMNDKEGKAIVSHNPDAFNILTVYNNKMYAVTHFEQPVPSVAYLSEIEQDSAGKLTMKSTMNIDFSKLGGLWIPCGGSISPWGSHLGSEEYEPNARAFFTSSTKKVNITTIDNKKYEVFDNIDTYMVNMASYLGLDPSTYKDGPAAAKAGLNPYKYGWSWEMKVTTEGKPDVKKLYNVGRISWEQLLGESFPLLFQDTVFPLLTFMHATLQVTVVFFFPFPVMPDRVTSYGSDDGTAVMWLRFVSAKPDTFDEGELFCAQLVQNTPCADANVCQGFDATNTKHTEGPASAFHASVSWLSMGKAKASEIELALTDFNKTGAPIKFTDMFDIPPRTKPEDPYYGTVDADGFNITDPKLATTADPKGPGYPCATGFKAINTQSTGGKTECLKIKSTRVKWASRLETRRYAAMLGCNTEMEKWEWSALDPIGNVMYTAISSASGMMAAKQPSGNGKPQDAIRIPKTASCGCVMETGFADSTYKTSYIKSHLCGSSAKIEAACNITSKDGLAKLAEDLAKDKDLGKKPYVSETNKGNRVCDSFLYNQCNTSAIANPDGLTFMTELNQLVIMEDSTTGHRNDAVWVQNAWDGKITRIFTTPLGSEATGAYWYPNLGPGNKGPFSYLGIVVQHPYDENDGGGSTSSFAPDANAKRGYVGVLGPLKPVNLYVSAASSYTASLIVSFVSVVSVSLVAF